MSKSIHNPEATAVVDTSVSGVNYVIHPGETIEQVPDLHAQNLLERYGFLQEVANAEQPQAESEPAQAEESVAGAADSQPDEVAGKPKKPGKKEKKGKEKKGKGKK